MNDTARIGRLQAAQDPRLLGVVPVWPVQEEVLAATDGPERIFVLRIGRRGGKGYIDALVAAHNALLSDHLSAYLRPGERRYIVAISRKGTQAQLVLQTVLQIVKASPTLAGTIESSSDDQIDFTNGVTMIAAANADSARGKPLSCVLFLEAAHFAGEKDDPEEAGDRSAVNAWKALSPGLAQFGDDGIVIVESTPRGRSGWFYDFCTRVESGEIPEARAFHYTTAEANPTISPTFLDSEGARDPDNYAVEFEALWSGGSSAFLDFDRFSAVRDVDVPPEDLIGPKTVGCDMAGAGGQIGLAVVGRDPADPRRMVCAHVDGLKVSKASTLLGLAKLQTNLLDRVVKVAKRYDAEVVVDQFSSTQVRTHFTAAGVKCKVLTQGAATKDSGYREVRDRLYSGGLEIPADPPLIADLRRLRTRTTSTGSSVVNPRLKGQHGDRCSALVLAVQRQVEHGVTGVPQGPPSGGPPLAGVATGDTVLRQRTPNDLREARKSNKYGRSGKRDPDRPGHRFGGGSRWP